MDLVTLNYVIGLIFCLVVVSFILVIPPAVRRRYSKYDEFEQIKNISEEHNIMKPGYLMLNLDYQHEDSWFFRWVSWGFEEIPRNTDDPILFLKKSIASIENKEEKKIYTEWLINQLSEKAQKSTASKAYYEKLEKSVHKIYDNIVNLDFSTEEEISGIKVKLEDIISQVAKSTSSNGNSKIENPKTIELYLRNLVKNPLDGIGTIQENLDESGVIPDSDADKFPGLKFGTLRGWEQKFFKILEDHCYDKYAQRFKRFKASE